MLKFLNSLKSSRKKEARTDPRTDKRGRDTKNTGPVPIYDPELAREVDLEMQEAIRREEREEEARRQQKGRS